jgi:outer membrane protein TolC
MEVLLTRRDSLEAQMDLIDTKNRQMQAMVGIYQALGGGWK